MLRESIFRWVGKRKKKLILCRIAVVFKKEKNEAEVDKEEEEEGFGVGITYLFATA